MSDLVRIDASVVPPTHQSTELLMGCKKNYVTQVIEGRKSPGGVESVRGREIHHVMSLYLSHCARVGVATDLDAFDRFAIGAGVLASKILVGIRDSYLCDYEHLFATELKMRLDEEFRPTHLELELEGVCFDSENAVAYEGTLDGLCIYREENRIEIPDFKSHPRPYNPDDPDKSMQGKEYSLFCFQHFTWVQEVKFRLHFVRFRNLFREVIYKREDVPALIDAVRSLRNRQKAIHEDYMDGLDIEATGNDGCFYCPLLAGLECPIAQENPAAMMKPEEWVSASLFYSAYATVNRNRMKAYVQATGRKIILKDYNGRAYSYGPVEKKGHVYPLFAASPQGGLLRDHRGTPILPIIDLLLEHVKMDPDDVEWLTKLSISGTKLESYLKAKSRAITHQAITDTADEVTKVTLKVSKPLDVEDIQDEFEDEDEFEEGEF